MRVSTAKLPKLERNLHRMLIDGLLANGELPIPETLTEATGIDRSELSSRLAVLEAADYLALNDEDWPVCLYPFSPISTPHVVAFDGVRRYAMCSIDALGMAAMLDQSVKIESVCPVCRTTIRLDVSPGTITKVQPAEAVVVAASDADRPACESCCPSTVFACNQEHGQELAAKLPSISVLSLDEALESGERIFGGLLAEQLPARRPRFHRELRNGKSSLA